MMSARVSLFSSGVSLSPFCTVVIVAPSLPRVHAFRSSMGTTMRPARASSAVYTIHHNTTIPHLVGMILLRVVLWYFIVVRGASTMFLTSDEIYNFIDHHS